MSQNSLKERGDSCKIKVLQATFKAFISLSTCFIFTISFQVRKKYVQLKNKSQHRPQTIYLKSQSVGTGAKVNEIHCQQSKLNERKLFITQAANSQVLVAKVNNGNKYRWWCKKEERKAWGGVTGYQEWENTSS